MNLVEDVARIYNYYLHGPNRCVTQCCSALQCVAVCCIVLHGAAGCRSCVALFYKCYLHGPTTGVCCRVWQGVAGCGRVWQ